MQVLINWRMHQTNLFLQEQHKRIINAWLQEEIKNMKNMSQNE